MKKIFGELNLTWKKVIIGAVLIGLFCGLIALVPSLVDTSFTDLLATFEVWILFGILIIMNSKSPKESALKCFVFFLISQPLIYLTQDIIGHTSLFMTYYKFWVVWTLACLPMGFVGYYMKKDKWWGLLILLPILVFLGYHYNRYFTMTMYSFPRHILTTLFIVATLIIYPLFIFKNKKIKTAGVIISALIIIAMTGLGIYKPEVYSTDILTSGNKYTFDDTYKVYLEDDKYGDLSFRYEEVFDDWTVHAEFKRAGKTKVILESPDGKKKKFNINIGRTTFEIKEIKNQAE